MGLGLSGKSYGSAGLGGRQSSNLIGQCEHVDVDSGTLVRVASHACRPDSGQRVASDDRIRLVTPGQRDSATVRSWKIDTRSAID